MRDVKVMFQCLEHWLENFGYATAGTLEFDHISGEECPACQEYFDSDKNLDDCCTRCPIFEHTGYSNCVGTPYRKVVGEVDGADEEYSEAIELAVLEEYQFLAEVTFDLVEKYNPRNI